MPIMDSSDDEETTINMQIDKNPAKRQKTKESDDLEQIFANDDRFFKEVLQVDRSEMTDQEYVAWQIKVMKKFFDLDRGAKEEKKANLGDIKSTKIESPFILNHSLFDPKLTNEEKKKTPLIANVKAVVPILREKFMLVQDEIGGQVRDVYKKVNQNALDETLAFGIVTAR
jgi:hypothetical protein